MQINTTNSNNPIHEAHMQFRGTGQRQLSEIRAH